MNWFIRWVIVAASLNIIVVIMWRIFLIDQLPVELWLTLLTVGLGSVGIGGLLAISATDSMDELDRGFVWGPSKSVLKRPDLEDHLRTRTVRWIETSPAIWSIVAAGVVSIIVSILIKFMP